jgi:hypothetical protein
MNHLLFTSIDFQVNYYHQLEKQLPKRKDIQAENVILKRMVDCVKNAELLSTQIDITKLLNVTV